MSDLGRALFEVGAFGAQVSRFSAAEAESFLYAFLSFFGSEFANFDNIDIHGVGILSFGGGGEGLVGLVSGFGVSFGDFVSALPLGLEGDGFLIPIIDGRRDSVHRHDLVHEERGDAHGEVPNKNILIYDACKGGVVFEMRDILAEGQRVGIVFSLGHAFSGEPSDGVTRGIVVFECSFKFGDEVREGPHGYGGPSDGILPEGGCPSEGGSFGHLGQGEGDFLVVIIVDFFVNKEVELYSIQPLGGLIVGSIKGFRCSNVEFGGFR